MTKVARTTLSTVRGRIDADPSAADAVVSEAHEKAAASPASVFIHRVPLDAMRSELAVAKARRDAGEKLPLFGVPYALKDTFDVEGLPTTAACPAFSYVAKESATVVDRLRAAGAILVGKTNLDQFATGLVGVRSPYGMVENPFDRRFIAGGSSSGSAVAVATDVVPFSIGTDTAGSGRVPAAFCELVGTKPTRGLLSAKGLVPACRTLDCASVFAHTPEDARVVLEACRGFDPEDPSSRDLQAATLPRFARPIRFGVPRDADLEFFGDSDAARLYADAIARLSSLGATRIEIDLTPFRAAADLLYKGPWVAERLSAAGELLERDPGALHPVLRGILERAKSLSALSAYEGLYRLAEARRATEAEWAKMDVLFLPTTPTTYTIEEILADPIEKNSRLGYYTQFANLLDLAAVAVPAGRRRDGLPLGVSFIGPAFSDGELLAIASEFCADHGSLGSVDVPRAGDVLLVVAGAHLSGQPLNHQLTSRRARLVRACKTSPEYRLYALGGTVPPKPGLVFDPAYRGAGIDIEVWSLDRAAFGSFVDEVPPPLAIGTVKLEDGTSVNGFVCESYALANATEITEYGGWRAYRAAVAKQT